MRITAVIKTFERRERLLKLLESLRLFYLEMPVIILDDSREEMPDSYFDENMTYLHTEFDIGLADGRNRLLDLVRTKYFVLLDDDFEFTYRTNLMKMYQCLETTDYKLVAGLVLNFGYRINLFDGIFEFENNDFVIYPEQNRGEHAGYLEYDIVHNFFMAETDAIKEIRWDNDFKLNEHEDFFIRMKQAGYKITLLKDVYISHYPVRTDNYDTYRNRIAHYHQMFLDKYRLNRRYKKYTKNRTFRRFVFQLEKAMWFIQNVLVNKVITALKIYSR